MLKIIFGWGNKISHDFWVEVLQYEVDFFLMDFLGGRGDWNSFSQNVDRNQEKLQDSLYERVVWLYVFCVYVNYMKLLVLQIQMRTNWFDFSEAYMYVFIYIYIIYIYCFYSKSLNMLLWLSHWCFLRLLGILDTTRLLAVKKIRPNICHTCHKIFVNKNH